MINNDILRNLRTIFGLTDDKIRAIFALSNCDISAAQLDYFFKEKNDATYKTIEDVEFAGFLNGLIIEKRGPSDGPARETETSLTNNMVFNKVKIALSLKADDVIRALSDGGITLDKYELSALFRNPNHKNYKLCSDETLSAFLKGLKTDSF
jgi:uncharacterized protein YehS (DUF1456 family)